MAGLEKAMTQKIWMLLITFPLVFESAVLNSGISNQGALAYEDGSHITSFWDNFDTQEHATSQQVDNGDTWHPFRRQDGSTEEENASIHTENVISGANEDSANSEKVDIFVSITTTEKTVTDDIKLQVPEKYFRIPHSQSHLKKLVRAMVTRNICSRQDKESVIRILSEGRKRQPTLDDLGLVESASKTRSFILCRIKWRSPNVNRKRSKNEQKRERGDKSSSSSHKKRRTRRLKLHKNASSGDTFSKWSQCDWDSIQWNFTHLSQIENKLQKFHCWDEETSALHSKVSQLMMHVSQGKRRYHKLQHLKCDLVAALNLCRDNYFHPSTEKTTTTTTQSTTTERVTTTQPAPTVTPTPQTQPQEHTVSIEVLRELQRDMGFDYNSGVFDEPFLFY